MDLKTLEFANAAMLWVDVLVIWLFGRSHPSLRGSAWFARGTTCLAVGAVLVAAPSTLPLVLSAVGANFLAVAGFVLINRGIACYLGRANHTRGFELLLLAAATCASVYFTFLHRDVWLRSALISFALGIELTVAATLLRRPVRPRRLGERAVETWPAALAVLAFAVFNLARGAFTLLAGHHATEEHQVQVVVAVGIMAFGAGLTLGYVWMMTAEIHAELERLARIDALTGVLNRGAVAPMAVAAVAAARALARPVALAAFDLDRFKSLNDEFGHAAGDMVLAQVAGLIHSEMDGCDLLARMGGEEFVALLPGKDDAAAIQWAEALRLRIERMRIDFEGSVITLTTSVGVAQLNPGDDTWTALLVRADRALYLAKQRGRNRVATAPHRQAAAATTSQ